MPRNYTNRTLKMLWMRSAGRCAYPDCLEVCDVEAEHENDTDAIICQMAHIFAYSDDARRPNPSMLDEEKNDYDNLLILCANHHIVVDNQENAYTVTVLKLWKQNLETWIDEQLERSNLKVSFVELEMVTRALLQNPNILPSEDFSVITPLEKMNKNNLSENILKYVNMGMLHAPQVDSYVRHEALINRQYPEQLKAGFLATYNRLTQAGILGDELFHRMWDFAAQHSKDFDRKMTALAVLIYLFQICEIFEK